MVLELGKTRTARVVETGDNIIHPIKHVGDVSLSHVGQKGVMRNILHVSTTAKSLVSVGKIVDQSMQV